MIFSSAGFLAGFLPIVLLGYLLLRWKQCWHASQVWLLLSSFVFYAFSGWNTLPVLLGSIACNFTFGYGLHLRDVGKLPGPAVLSKRVLLGLGIGFNLTLLGFFKYWCFIKGHFTAAACTTGIELPLAISFFTFQQIAWLCDVYNGKVARVKPVNYALFVSFFPQLIAGPIVHYRYVRKQFDRRRTLPKGSLFFLGLVIFSLGMAKKVLLADPLKNMVDAVYIAAADPNYVLQFTDLVVASIGYGLQLYFDFSGYADMAIGLAAIFGIRLPINFRSPYRAASIIDFWRCWHITLSRFLRDYLYIPMGGGFRGKTRRYVNLLITMLLGGLWHGAGWGFVLWGGAHGLLLTVNHLGREYLPYSAPKIFNWVLTFLAVNLLWVLFRADSVEQAFSIYASLLNPAIWVADWSWWKVWLESDWLLNSANLDRVLPAILFFSATIVALQPHSTTRIWSGGTGKPNPWICAFAGGCLFFGIRQLLIVEPATFVYFRF